MRFLTERRFHEHGFYWESRSDSENALVVFLNEADGLSVAVSDEKAVDSYNSTFECCAFLDREDAERLRDYLMDVLPP